MLDIKVRASQLLAFRLEPALKMNSSKNILPLWVMFILLFQEGLATFYYYTGQAETCDKICTSAGTDLGKTLHCRFENYNFQKVILFEIHFVPQV